jgi:hypothetical protein
VCDVCVCLYVVCMVCSMCDMCADLYVVSMVCVCVHGNQKVVSDSLKLELQVAVSSGRAAGVHNC